MIGWLTLPRALSVCDIPSKIDLLNLILHPTVLGIINLGFYFISKLISQWNQPDTDWGTLGVPDRQSEPDDKLKSFNETKTVKARMKLIALSLSPCWPGIVLQ